MKIIISSSKFCDAKSLKPPPPSSQNGQTLEPSAHATLETSPDQSLVQPSTPPPTIRCRPSSFLYRQIMKLQLSSLILLVINTTSSMAQASAEEYAIAACGRLGFCPDGVSNPSVLPVSSTLAARCCSDVEIAGWNKAPDSCGNLWLYGKDQSGICMREVTYEYAKQACTDLGARLCTKDEYLDDCTGKAYCKQSDVLNWSSTVYEHPSSEPSSTVSSIPTISNTGSSVSPNQSTCGAMQDRFNVKFDAMDDKMDDEFDSVDDKFDAMDDKFDTMDDKFDAMDDKFDTMDDKMNAMDGKFISMDDKFDAMDDKMNAMDEKFDSMDDKFDAMDNKMNAMDDNFNSKMEKMFNLLECMSGSCTRYPSSIPSSNPTDLFSANPSSNPTTLFSTNPSLNPTNVPTKDVSFPGRMLSLGSFHSCAADDSNYLFCWGWNDYGQLGNGMTSDKNTPTPISLGSESTSQVKEISLGFAHTCVIDTLNKLFCWGGNNNGQLGDASNTNRLTPTEIDLGIASYAVQVSLGYWHTCAIDSLNNLLCWGWNLMGQLGDGTSTNRNTPVVIAAGTDPSYAIQISLGGLHACAIFSSGDLRCWGSNTSGQLGNGGTSNSNTPTLISLGVNVTPTQVELGLVHTCAVDHLSLLRCWGDNKDGQLGDGSNVDHNTPTPVSLPSDAANIIQLSLGFVHTCAISDTNDLMCWGYNDKGSLGDGTTVNKYTPTSISLGGIHATQIALGDYHTCAVDNADVLYCWGDNSSGQLGDDSKLDSLIPKVVQLVFTEMPSQSPSSAPSTSALPSANPSTSTLPSALPSTNPSSNPTNVPTKDTSFVGTMVSLGGDHSCAADDLNYLFCWGYNNKGQLGNGSTVYKNTLTSISLGSESTSQVKKISLGYWHTCAIDTLDKLFCWGWNIHGQVGDASNIDRHTPTEIDLGIVSSHAVQVSLGPYHSCAIDSLNNLLCWGYNQYGQLGDGTSDHSKNSPVVIVPGTASSYVIQISLGAVHTCAIFSNDDLKCWGEDTSGQLGNGNNSSRYTPTLISLGVDVTPTQIELGLVHTCAVDDQSALRCWGDNINGQLGDGSNTNRNTPTIVSLPSVVASIIQLSLGYYHTCAISDTNDLMCWGYNYKGQLGDNTNANRNTPTSISLGGVYATQIALGSYHTCAYDNSDVLYCWGDNGKGQLADGTNSDSLIPKVMQFIFTEMPSLSPSTNPTNVPTKDVFISGTMVHLGFGHSCAADDSNYLFCWGWNDYGQLGNGMTLDKNTPTSISLGSESTSQVQAISLGWEHTCAIDTLDKLFCWGWNIHGQVGDASNIDRHTPTEIDLGIVSSHAVQVSLGPYHSCAIDSLNNLLCWGYNQYGQLGDGTSDHSKNSPVVIVPGTASSYAIQVSLGTVHTCAIFSNGDLKCWGSSFYGQLGNGGNSDRHTPTLISLGTDVTATQIELGGHHTCVVDDKSALRCWGSNINGQLGDGSNVDRNTPTPVSLPSDVATITQLALGFAHTCATTDTNDLLCWGWNDKGQLGDSTNEDRYTPISISLGGADGGVYATQIASGYMHTCAFDNSDYLYCWGLNDKGQLGDGSNSDSSTPKALFNA